MRYYNPELVVLQGEMDWIDYLEPQDIDILEGDFTIEDLRNLNAKYPELLGVWAVLAKVGKKVGKGLFKGIRKRIRAKRKKKKKRKQRKKLAAKRKAAEQKRQQQIIAQQQYQRAAAQKAQSEQQQKNLLTMAALALPAMFLLGK